MQITHELLRAGRSSAGGFNLSQLRVLGVAPERGWPEHGWAFDLIGKEISDADYAKFLALTGEAGRQKKQPKIVPQAEQPTLL